MKIGIVHFNLTAERSDSRIVFSLAQAFRKMGCGVTVFAGDFDPYCFPVLHRGLDIRVARHSVPIAASFGNFSIRARLEHAARREFLNSYFLRRISEMIDPYFDAIICGNDDSYRLGLALKRKNPQTRVVWTMHNPPFEHHERVPAWLNVMSRINAKLEKQRVKYHLPGVDHVVVPDPIRQQAAAAAGIRTHILPVPVDYQHFYAPIRKVPRHGPVNLMGIGALQPQRRFEDLLLAAAELRETNHEVRVVLIASDIWRNRDYRHFLVDLARQQGLQRSVQFHFGQVSDEAYRTLLLQGHIAVFLNVFQTWSMAKFEAMAAGLPLILARPASPAGVLRDGSEALHVDAARPDQIADRVRQLITRPELYRRLALAGQEFVRKNLSWEDYARDLLEIARAGPQGEVFVSKVFRASA